MIYLLDTNTCIYYLNNRSSNITRRVQAEAPADIATCAVVRAELFLGAMKSNNPVQTLARQQAFIQQFVSLPFDDHAADIYANIRAQLELLGTPIGPNDYMIAAIALANNLILVTHNLREFGRVQGLQLEDWQVNP